MSYRDELLIGLGWQLAIVVRFAIDFALDRWDRRKARRARLAQPAETP